MFQAQNLTNENPFKECYIHGLIRAKDGRKMSKSLGNGIEPLEMVEKYGADALRFYLTTNSAAGMDLRFDEDKMTSTWNFINKLWNASRFVLMNIEGLKEQTTSNLKLEDKWILTKLNKTIKEVRKNMEKYDFNLVGSSLYNFIWEDFCDNYIELSKAHLNDETTKTVLLQVLTDILKMLHPFMPYVTEEIYQMLPIKETESIMISNYPKYEKKFTFSNEEELVDSKIKFISAFRNVKLENNIPKDAKVLINTRDEIIVKMLKLNDVMITNNLDIKAYNVDVDNYKATIFYEKEETEEDKAAKEKQINDLKASIERRKKLLSNENYVAKAPEALVQKERETLAKEEEQLAMLTK
jgi:valyl-tRNA synthetase